MSEDDRHGYGAQKYNCNELYCGEISVWYQKGLGESSCCSVEKGGNLIF